jgi:aminoglycoside phosphotransferase (APT) family kinase protein
MGPVSVPSAEVSISAAMVKRLLADQHPDLASLPLRLVAEGWDNVTYRLGGDLAVRLPRREVAVPLLETELRWLPQVARLVELPVPEPVRGGLPGVEFPWPWNVVSWIPGLPVGPTRSASSEEAAYDLGRFVRQLHVAAPESAPRNPWRGCALADRTDSVQQYATRVSTLMDTTPLLRRWQVIAAESAAPGFPVWVHGDLHPLNILTEHGRITGVIDFGDLTAGDSACDLALAWMMFEEPAREVFLSESAATEADARRGCAWAILFALAFLAHSADSAEMRELGVNTVRRIVENDIGDR